MILATSFRSLRSRNQKKTGNNKALDAEPPIASFQKSMLIGGGPVNASVLPKKMKKYLLVIIAVLVSPIPGLADDERTVSLEGIFRADQIVGHLGKPLGTVMTIRGESRFSPVPNMKKPHPKGGTDRFMLVTHVNDTKLPKPVELEVFPTSMTSLNHGDRIVVRAYERLMTLGVPQGLQQQPVVQARSSDLEFHLACYLCIVEEQNAGRTKR